MLGKTNDYLEEKFIELHLKVSMGDDKLHDMILQVFRDHIKPLEHQVKELEGDVKKLKKRLKELRSNG